jgi:hypothetical protein
VKATLANDFDSEEFAERIDYTETHAVQAAGDFVSTFLAAELPARMQHAENRL